jgi:hypothetical protein
MWEQGQRLQGMYTSISKWGYHFLYTFMVISYRYLHYHILSINSSSYLIDTPSLLLLYREASTASHVHQSLPPSTTTSRWWGSWTNRLIPWTIDYIHHYIEYTPLVYLLIIGVGGVYTSLVTCYWVFWNPNGIIYIVYCGKLWRMGNWTFIYLLLAYWSFVGLYFQWHLLMWTNHDFEKGIVGNSIKGTIRLIYTIWLTW